MILVSRAETIYVKDDQDFWWEVSKAVIANLFQTLFLIVFTLLCWIAKRFLIAIFECCCCKKDDDMVYKG